MNRAEAVAAVAEKTEMKKSDVENVLDTFFNSVLPRALKKEGEVIFTGTVSFKSVQRAARNGVNPQTGEKIKIAARKAIKISAGKKLKDAVL